MPYVIAEPCNDVKDKACVEACPVDCIYEVGSQLMINPEECIDCGACAPACPVDAIFAEEEVPDDQSVFTEIDALWFQDKDAARAKIPS